MSPLMVVADSEGNLFEHPELEMVGAQGTEPVAPEPEELSPLPGGSKFFTIPDSIPVGGDPEEDALISVEEADWGDGAAALQAACTFPSPGWMRTLLPFAERDPGAQTYSPYGPTPHSVSMRRAVNSYAPPCRWMTAPAGSPRNTTTRAWPGESSGCGKPIPKTG